MLTPQLDQRLAQHKKKQSCTDQVKWVLKRLLGGPRPEINEVAKELGMSSRTLQRRITDEGTGYRQLLNDARHELARFYLKVPSLSVGEIAYLLSYEDPSSFFRPGSGRGHPDLEPNEGPKHERAYFGATDMVRLGSVCT